MYEARYELLLSSLIFLLAIGIGVLSCHADPDFLRVILGDSYVEMTEENIRSGDPMAVYKQKGEFNIFLGITLHNLMVAFQTFLMGIFYAIGTVGSLLYNGVMLGAFQYFFVEKGLFRESFLAVWMHGAFEISSIMLAGAAGLTMGKGLVFPGTLSRLRSFQLAARRGMSIMLGIVPLFVAAGFIESYFTRHTEVPDGLRGAFIFGCFAAVIYYFVIYPAKKARLGFRIELPGQILVPEVSRAVDFTVIKTAGDLFSDAFIFYRNHFKPIAWAAAGGAAVYCAGAFLGSSEPPAKVFAPSSTGLFGAFLDLPGYFVNEHHAWLFPFTTLALGTLAFTVQYLLVKNSFEDAQTIKPSWQMLAGFLKTLVAVALMNLVVLTMQWWTLPLMMFIFPLLFLWNQVMLTEQESFVPGLGRAFFLARGSFAQMAGLFFTLLLCGALFFLILGSGILWFLMSIVSMNFFLPESAGELVTTLLLVFLTFFVVLLIFGLWAVGCGLQYFSSLELCEAKFMKERIAGVGRQVRIRGVEREG